MSDEIFPSFLSLLSELRDLQGRLDPVYHSLVVSVLDMLKGIEERKDEDAIAGIGITESLDFLTQLAAVAKDATPEEGRLYRFCLAMGDLSDKVHHKLREEARKLRSPLENDEEIFGSFSEDDISVSQESPRSSKSM